MIKNLLAIFKESSSSFEGQEEGEEVILLVRKHVFPLSLRLSFLFSTGLIPIVIWVVFYSYILNFGMMPIFLFISSLWYMFLLVAIFHTLTIYTLKTIIITNRRIIENEQHGFFNREISELPFSRVQDVSVHISGMIETILKFGNIMIQTAASEKQFVFRDLPQPEKIKDTIMQTVHNSNAS